MLKRFRFILFPLSVLYGTLLSLRNWLYDRNIFKSSAFNFPVICVGNLAVGGTGKTPMVEYLIRLLKDDYKVATLSRGYKRKTIGFAIAGDDTTALDIGDEPMQFHKKFHDIMVAVAEERLVAIPQLLHARPGTEVIILDDALQHRQVRAGLNILLTEYTNLYTRDVVLPAGDLRDVKSSSRRADIIVVTKCKPELAKDEKSKIVDEVAPLPGQHVFFSRIDYDVPLHLFGKKQTAFPRQTHILMICGIANPKPLREWLQAGSFSFDMMVFDDHHIFDIDDLKNIKKHFEKIEGESKIILTTEKDGVRLTKFESELKDLPIFVLPIKHKIMFGGEEEFASLVYDFVGKYKKDATR